MTWPRPCRTTGEFWWFFLSPDNSGLPVFFGDKPSSTCMALDGTNISPAAFAAILRQWLLSTSDLAARACFWTLAAWLEFESSWVLSSSLKHVDFWHAHFSKAMWWQTPPCSSTSQWHCIKPVLKEMKRRLKGLLIEDHSSVTMSVWLRLVSMTYRFMHLEWQLDVNDNYFQVKVTQLISVVISDLARVFAKNKKVEVMSDLARGILDDRGRQIVDNLNLGRPFVCQRVSQCQWKVWHC